MDRPVLGNVYKEDSVLRSFEISICRLLREGLGTCNAQKMFRRRAGTTGHNSTLDSRTTDRAI